MYSITELIPQRAPIVMIDNFLGLEEGNVSRSCLTVRADNLFVTEGRLDECGLIEHVAQSAAARMGYICLEAGKAVPLGYIGSVDDFCLITHARVNETIVTEITILQEVFNISLIKARCRVGERYIATCKMKIFLDQ